MRPEIAEKLARAREAKAQRAEAAEEAAALREIELHELTEKYEAELGGKRGVAFDIVETVEGPIVIKLGEVLVYQKFQNSPGYTEPQASAYVRPSVVFPALDKFLSICAVRGGVLFECVKTLNRLHTGRVEEERGK